MFAATEGRAPSQHPSTGTTEIYAPGRAFFGTDAVTVLADGEGLSCSTAGDLTTCSSATAGAMKVTLVAASPEPAPDAGSPQPEPQPDAGSAPPPAVAAPAEESSNCGLFGIEILVLWPLQGAARRIRRRRGKS